MKLTKESNKITILNENNFNIKDILECGQVFSFEKIDENNYVVISCDKLAKIYFDEAKTIIQSDDIEYFYNYFDLDTDYQEINKKIIERNSSFKKFVKGELRILKQDPFQTIISFIVSQNNNIKRIKKILNKISEKCSNKINDQYYAFPNLNQIKKLTKEDFDSLGAGYRSSYLVNSIKMLCGKDYDIETLKKLSSEELKQKLLNLCGVGPKVADCILLFGFGRTDYFPVDTWIKKAYIQLYNDKTKSAQDISKFFVSIFKEVSGYAQQYLYDYMLKNNNI